MQEIWVWSLGRENLLEDKMVTHSSILAWEILRTEEPGGLQSMGSQKSWTWLSNWTATTWAAGKNRKYPLSISPLLSAVRWILGYSLPAEVLQALLPVSAQNSSYFSNLLSILWESHILLALIQQKVCKLLLFCRKEERKGCHLRQLCHSLTWLSCFCPEAVPPKLLWDILTEEELTTDSRGTTSYIRVHTIWMPSILVFWGIH